MTEVQAEIKRFKDAAIDRFKTFNKANYHTIIDFAQESKVAYPIVY